MNKKSFSLMMCLFFVNLLVIIAFWYNSSPINNNISFIDGLISLGRISGLLLAYFLLVQLILIGRLKAIEGYLGHDKLARLHRQVGIYITIFLVAHPILLAAGYSLNNGISFINQFYNFIFRFEGLSGASIATMMLILVILFSTGVLGRRWKYERWYLSHLFAYVAIFMGFGHQLELGGDFSQRIFAIYWYLLFVGSLILFAYSRFLKPLNNFRIHQFQISRIVMENTSVYSVFITGKHLDKFKLSGGQFAIFRFLNKNLWFEAHPFSFSSAIRNNELRISIKKLGNFTEKLPEQLKVGTKVLIEGPLGVFTARRNANKYLLIAGGIGITPVRALSEELVNQQKDVKVFVSTNTPAEEVFRDEMLAMTSSSNFSYFRFFAEGTENQGEQKTFSGRIDLEKIKSLLPDWQEREIYFCGPPAMSKALNQAFLRAGVSKNKIHFERFSF